jgi:hypothetical protein
LTGDFSAARSLQFRRDMRLQRLVPVLAIATLTGCPCDPGVNHSHAADVVGPFTGPTQRFVVDSITLPLQRSDFAEDLDGDGKPDNQLGNIFGLLSAGSDVPLPDALIASGLLAPVVEIQSDDPQLLSDPTVGARFIGKDGEDADQLGGVLAAGVLTTNRTATTTHPGSATLHLPIFPDSDPIAVPIRAVELKLTSDGQGGFEGQLNAGVPAPEAQKAAFAAFTQLITSRPVEYPVMAWMCDGNGDGQFTFDEFANNSIIKNVMAPDVSLFDGDVFSPGHGGAHDLISIGITFHLKPCAQGRCAPSTPAMADHCSNRVRDDEETDVDCGGTCKPCGAPAAACLVNSDCESARCDHFQCAAATCTDGVRDGLESDIDCGHGCTPCHDGATCSDDRDCASGSCHYDVGTCGPPQSH